MLTDSDTISPPKYLRLDYGIDPLSPDGVEKSDLVKSPRERVVNDIVLGLYEGRYHPGDRLIEGQLTEHYGISRGPVREALNRLAAMGVVELTLQRGAQIRTLTVKEAINVLLVGEHLVRLAARLAAANSHDKALAAGLQVALSRLEQVDPRHDPLAMALVRDQFYAALTRMAANEELARLLPNVKIHLIRAQFGAVLGPANKRAYKDYARLTEAIVNGQAAVADRAVKLQFEQTRQALQSYAQ